VAAAASKRRKTLDRYDDVNGAGKQLRQEEAIEPLTNEDERMHEGIQVGYQEPLLRSKNIPANVKNTSVHDAMAI
jgi:hypothetical protein